MFGFADFLKNHGHKSITVQLCGEPVYLSPHVLDPASKDQLLDQDFGEHTGSIHSMLDSMPAPDLKSKFSTYIKDFASRRNLDLTIYPESFVTIRSLDDHGKEDMKLGLNYHTVIMASRIWDTNYKGELVDLTNFLKKQFRKFDIKYYDVNMHYYD